MRIGFIGAGRMAQALCKGFIDAAYVNPAQILASDVNRAELRNIRELKVNTTLDNREVVRENDVIYVSVKPYLVTDVLRQVAPFITKKHLLVSVAAGVDTKTLEKFLPTGSRVVRVMPNTPAVVQAGACAFSRGSCADVDDGKLVARMLHCVGLVDEVPEDQMDAVTGLSGNGPAYGLVALQALADGGVKMGLGRDTALRLAAQTLMGTAKMVLETRRHPEQLKDDVCSPGGTTITALYELERRAFRAALIAAVESGTKRSREIGRLGKTSANVAAGAEDAQRPPEPDVTVPTPEEGNQHSSAEGLLGKVVHQ